MPNVQQTQAKPFLKWAGGKSQLLTRFDELFPGELKRGEIKNYYEPFLGSGAVFFYIMQHYKVASAWLYDVNPELILTWKTIQQQPELLIEKLSALEKKYHRLSKDQQSLFYYRQRESYNSSRPGADYKRYTDEWIKRSAQLIFLNRTCFNGLYRVNSKGDFNTPAGRYNNPTICDAQNLMAVNKLLQNVTIQHSDFKQVKKDLRKNAFVYFDPPYRPVSKTASFNAYAKEVFTDAEQKALCELFSYIHEKRQQVMLSNSDPKNTNPKDDFFDKLYRSYHITRIPAKRMINANAAKRGNISELVITNYPVK